MTILNAKNLSLNDVHRLLGFQKQNNGSFTPPLTLEPLTEYEQQELGQIREDFDHYLTEGRVLEGLVQALTVFPLMRLAGFYRHPLKLSLEQDIANISIEDEDATITGRFDILAINKSQLLNNIPFWVLVIESKNSQVDALAGLPQLLTYTYESLERQTSVWGITTNGISYRLVHLQSGSSLTYQLMPELNLIDFERSIQLLQVLKAICKLEK